ncbi:MAG: hypothetical protein ACI8S6_004255 [Myxococcota bacterium]|jgi:hypothetical protein
MLLGLMVTSALAGEWTQSAEEHGCTFYLGVRSGDYAPVRAVCQWDIPPEKLQAILAKSADHDRYFSSVAAAEQLPSGQFRQIHQASGISNREVIVDMGSTPIDGGVRYWWKKADDQSALTGDNVEVRANAGKWEVTAAPGGGSSVVYELLYDPGGSVPGFLVRWFQTAGAQDLVRELRDYAASH